MADFSVDLAKLPLEVKAKLAELDLELSEGDITEKGYEKKKKRILDPYIQHSGGKNAGNASQPSPQSAAQRKQHRRLTREDTRYHSEIRTEAVMQALAMQKKTSVIPIPSKRTSAVYKQQQQQRSNEPADGLENGDHVTSDRVTESEPSVASPEGSVGSSQDVDDDLAYIDSSSDDDSSVIDDDSHRPAQHSSSSSSSRNITPQMARHTPNIPIQSGSPIDRMAGIYANMHLGKVGTPDQRTTVDILQQQPGSYPRKEPPISGSGMTVIQPGTPPQGTPLRHYANIPSKVEPSPGSALADVIQIAQARQEGLAPPDLTSGTQAAVVSRSSVNRKGPYHQAHASSVRGSAAHAQMLLDMQNLEDGRPQGKVSAKIQQLLNTLKRPKRRPLREYFIDEEAELEKFPVDPNAPRPEGSTIAPTVGDSLLPPSGLPRNLLAALQRYGSASFKATCATVLDQHNGKPSVSLTYGKLLSRCSKIAYHLLHKVGGKGDPSVKRGDRVALVYPNNDPISFLCAFYGCVMADVVPFPVEVPTSKRDAGSSGLGFLLGSLSISVAMTSEACYKGLPKTPGTGEVVTFRGWPRLQWFVTENLGRVPRDWKPPLKETEDGIAYVEYTTAKDGSMMGVTHTRSSTLSNCQTLTVACNYSEGEVMVCVMDFKREVGLWHGILCSVFNGMHVIFVPYALMKVDPASWMKMITRFKATVAIVKSRDMHWGLLAQKDHKDLNLSSLRLLLVADGANPWSLTSCDSFLKVFQSKGLRPECLCPCASSPEALTVSVRRPGGAGTNSLGRGVLSMHTLSFGVVRVDSESNLTSLTLQDCGQVLPSATMVVVRLAGPPVLCKTDEVGELCLSAPYCPDGYWGLPGISSSTFKVSPTYEDGRPIGDKMFVRTGLLGFLGPGGLIFVCGSMEGLMQVSGRRHNSDDIIATVLAVEPMKFIYRGRIAVFSVSVLKDERIVIVAEQRPESTEEESFSWMSRVLQAVDSIHQVGVYCLVLVPPNYLPKTPLGGIHIHEARKWFVEGNLHPSNVLMCPHTCVTNLPKPREPQPDDVKPSAVHVGNIVQGARMAWAVGRDIGVLDEESDQARKYQYLCEILRYRASTMPEHHIYSLLNAKGQVQATLSCLQLHKKAEKIQALIDKTKLPTGSTVGLVFTPGLDLIAAFYGALYAGMVPVAMRPPVSHSLSTTLPTLKMVVEVSKSVAILTTAVIIKLLKTKEASATIAAKTWPVMLDTDDLPKKKLSAPFQPSNGNDTCYVDFSVSTTGMLAGIKMSHLSTACLCRAIKLQCELYPSRDVALCLDPYSGLGLVLWCMAGVYAGHLSLLIPPLEVEQNPALWLSTVSQQKIRDTFVSYGVVELCTRGLGTSVVQLHGKGVNLSCVRNLAIIAEERPRLQLTTSFAKLFSSLGLSARAVSTSFGCRVNVGICLQGASSPDPTQVYVDARALRNDRVTLVERGSPHSLSLAESGKLLPGVKVVIANPETHGQCADSHLGEIWVSSPFNTCGYFTIYGDDSLHQDHFQARLVMGDTQTVYARTGYLGFIRRTELTQHDGERHDAIYVVGALDETIKLRGMRYHPIDIENSVIRSHRKICESAVFTWNSLLVVVVELEGPESEALDLIPLVTSCVLEEHYLVVGVVVVVDPGVIPINSRGEKQRMHLRDGFLADQLDPIYVAYNM